MEILRRANKPTTVEGVEAMSELVSILKAGVSMHGTNGFELLYELCTGSITIKVHGIVYRV